MQKVKTAYCQELEKQTRKIEEEAKRIDIGFDFAGVKRRIAFLSANIALEESELKQIEQKIEQQKDGLVELFESSNPTYSAADLNHIRSVNYLNKFYSKRSNLLSFQKFLIETREEKQTKIREMKAEKKALSIDMEKARRKTIKEKYIYTSTKKAELGKNLSVVFLPIEKVRLALLGNRLSLKKQTPCLATLTREDFSRLVRLSKALDSKVSLEQDVATIDVDSSELLSDICDRQADLYDLSHCNQPKLQENIDEASSIRYAARMNLMKTRILKSLSKLLYGDSANEVTTSIDSQIADATNSNNQYTQLSENLTGILCKNRQDIFEKEQQISVKNTLIKTGAALRTKAQSSIKDVDTKILTLIRELLNKPEIGYEEGLAEVYAFLSTTNYELNTGKGRVRK